MVFKTHVEVGRIAMINYGEDHGSLCTIVNVINGAYALVDGPQNITGVSRQRINFKRLTLTPLKVKIPLNAKQKTISKAFKEGEIMAAWGKTALKRRIDSQEKRANTNDFDRFKVMLARKQRAKLIKKQVAALRG